MDDTTKNNVQQGAAMPQDMATPVAPANPIPDMTQPNPLPVDPMDSAKVPDLPTTLGVPAQSAMPTVDPMSAMQQMAGQPAQQPTPLDTNAMPQPVMPTAPMDAPAPVMSQPDPQMPTPSARQPEDLGPVTMEDLMEELQHIEDKLDEMDEKL